MPNRVSEFIEKAEQLDEGEGADERNRNRDCWDDGCTPVKQKKKDDDDHDYDCFKQRGQHFMDRVTDYSCRIEGTQRNEDPEGTTSTTRPALPCPGDRTSRALAFDNC